MNSMFIFLGALSAFLGVALGAIGAHALKTIISPEQLAVYHTAVDYQLWHALGLVCIGLLDRFDPGSKLLNWAGWLMFAGILLFSGSLYALVLLGAKWLGMITPFGGLGFLAAWACLMFFAARKA